MSCISQRLRRTVNSMRSAGGRRCSVRTSGEREVWASIESSMRISSIARLRPGQIWSGAERHRESLERAFVLGAEPALGQELAASGIRVGSVAPGA